MYFFVMLIGLILMIRAFLKEEFVSVFFRLLFGGWVFFLGFVGIDMQQEFNDFQDNYILMQNIKVQLDTQYEKHGYVDTVLVESVIEFNEELELWRECNQIYFLQPIFKDSIDDYEMIDIEKYVN